MNIEVGEFVSSNDSVARTLKIRLVFQMTGVCYLYQTGRAKSAIHAPHMRGACESSGRPLMDDQRTQFGRTAAGMKRTFKFALCVFVFCLVD